MKKYYYLLLVFFAIIFTACNDDDTTNMGENQTPVTDTEFAQNFGAEVQRDFIGQIVDTDNNPVVGAQVKIGSSNVQTDTNGVFIINGADVYEKFAYITATKPGFINGSRSLVPTSGKNNIKIMLLPATTIQVIASGENSTVDLPNGTKIVFDGAFADENGNAYSGNVNVSMFHLEASDENISSLMPGMLYAKTDSGQPVGLETFGMMHAQLTGSGGQKLQIASGHTAAITMKIDDTQLATAPSTIPLWHFDEVNGYWKQEGEATKQGNQYVGNVSHFSWWNCDLPFNTVMLTVNLQNSNGNPLSNLNVRLIRNNGFVGNSMTDGNGSASGMVPANESFTMEISIDTLCSNNQILKSTIIGPFTSNTTLPNIVIDEIQADFVSVQGNLVKCDNSSVTNGYVRIKYGYGNRSSIIPVTSGNFSFYTAVCSTGNPFTLYGVDLDTLQETGALTYTYQPVTFVGNIQACNVLTEFITYQIDTNTPVNVAASTITFTDYGIEGHLKAYNTPSNMLFDFWYYNIYGIGQYPLVYLATLTLNNVVYTTDYNATEFINITSWGEIGYYTLNFSGSFKDPQQLDHHISGSINIYDPQ